MNTLTASIQESLEAKREAEWKRLGVPDDDIDLSRLTGMDASDIGVFRMVSRQGFAIVVRCPKRTARAFHGVFPPKIGAVSTKSGESGVVVKKSAPGELGSTAKHLFFVSDYDLMSIWRRLGNHSEKVFASAAAGAKRGPMPPEARSVIVELNKHLVSRIQHGCQDDFLSPDNPGVKSLDHFVGFDAGAAEYLQDPPACAQYYARRDMKWPYDVTSGKFVL